MQFIQFTNLEDDKQYEEFTSFCFKYDVYRYIDIIKYDVNINGTIYSVKYDWFNKKFFPLMAVGRLYGILKINNVSEYMII